MKNLAKVDQSRTQMLSIALHTCAHAIEGLSKMRYLYMYLTLSLNYIHPYTCFSGVGDYSGN